MSFEILNMDIRELKSLLSRYHIRPDKSLGQNFLLSEKVLDEIITAAELKPTDTVLEIGAGLGILTKALAEKAGQVIAIEKDRKLAHALRKMFTPLSSPLGKGGKRGVVKIINEDALFFDFSNFQLPTSKLLPTFHTISLGNFYKIFYHLLILPLMRGS